MTFVSSFSDPLLVYVVIGGIGIVLALAITVYLKMKKPEKTAAGKKTGTKAGRLAYQPEARPVPVLPHSVIPRPARKIPAHAGPKDISIIRGRDDITKSFRALAEKYSLDQCTIATADGLVFASSGGEDARTDAAQYGGIFFNDPLSQTPGVVLAGINHMGSELVLIIKTPVPLREELRESIVKDTKDILNWWI